MKPAIYEIYRISEIDLHYLHIIPEMNDHYLQRTVIPCI